MTAESFLIDANALVSYLTARIPRQAALVEEHINRASNVECEIIVTQSVMNDLVFVLEDIYGFEPSAIVPALNGLLRNPGIRLVHGSYPERVLQLWNKSYKDYGDALLACAAEDLHFPIYTFDKPFYKELKKAGISAKLLV